MERLEQELKLYFRCEVESAAPTQDWWEKAVSSGIRIPQQRAKASRSGWIRNLPDILHINPKRPVWGLARYLVLLLLFGAISNAVYLVISFRGAGASGPAPMAENSISFLEVAIPILVFILSCVLTLTLMTWKWERKRRPDDD